MSDKVIRPVFPKQENGNIFHVKDEVDWYGFTKKIKEAEEYNKLENRFILAHIRFFVAYYNSSAYQSDEPISPEKFHSILKEDNKSSDIFRSFIFNFTGIQEEKSDLKVSDLNEDFINNTKIFIEEKNILDEFLIDKDLLSSKRDFSKADTTNIMLSLI